MVGLRLLVRSLLPLASVPLWIALPACAPVESQCEERLDLLAGPEGLVLVEEEHPAGWGSDQCMACHNLEAIHTVNCTSEPSIDMEEVRTRAEEGSYEACMECHGANGVSE